MEYYSQVGQDRYLNEEIFKGKEAGYFVDVGAHNGITFSNTYFFEKYTAWQGICIEPLPEIFQQLKNNRTCICLEGAVSLNLGAEDFLRIDGYSEMLSGLVNEYDPRHIERLNIEQKLYGGTSKTIRVNTYPLQYIFDNYALTDIDLLSVDTEGSELAVLQSIEFPKTHIHCIVVENNYQESDVQDYLSLHGYELIKKLHWDDVFLHSKSKYLKNIQR